MAQPNLKSLGIGLLIFATLLTLLVAINNGFRDSYDLEENLTIDGESMTDKLENLAIISSLNQTAEGAYKIVSPTSAGADILGGLALAGLGILSTLGAIFILPVQVIGIISDFYTIPPALSLFVGIGILLTIVLSILSKYLGGGDI